jgi:diguanylate cyclase (GGDEF)-like protein/PAS domain S-box-containing protein
MSMVRPGPISRVVRRVVGLRGVGVVLAVVVFGLAALMTLQFKHMGERGLQAELDLQGAVTELRTQEALEWQALSGRVLMGEISEQVAASRGRGQLYLDRAERELAVAGHDRVGEAHLRYARAADVELTMLADGQAELAREYDETTVDPAFDGALTTLSDYSAVVGARARRAKVIGDVGVLLTVLLSLALTGLVQGRRKRAEVQRMAERRAEAQYRALVDQSSDLVLVSDRVGRVRYVSPSAKRVLQWPPGRAPGDQDLNTIVQAEDRAALSVALQVVGDGTDGSVIELRLHGLTGLRTFEVTVRDLTADPAVAGIVLTAHDITDRLAMQQEMQHRAMHDTLTGLPNRALLGDRFDQALRQAARDGNAVGLLLIDLDRFKEINDTLGHHYGDQLLVQVGPRLVGALRQVDTVARLGGDEFAVLLPQLATVEDAMVVANKLQAALSRPFTVDGVDLDVEASIGAVLSGDHGLDPVTLMQRADIAMYVAKHHNLSVAAYDPSTDAHSPERLALLGDLRRAIGNDELFLQYQPKVSLTTGEICGAEALVRWDHPDHGLVQPDAFIPLAENTGLIGPLTRRVLDLALAQARRWVEQGHPLQVAVNLSARNLLDDRLEAMVLELLSRHQISPRMLKLEITESAIMTDPVRAKEILDRLDGHGIALSIDDFGAGYTSLAQLKNLPISELKVDRSFVMSMQTDTSNAVIVRSVIELGHNLGLIAVAEGVEDAEALTSLTGYTCDVAQGYHVSRPLSAVDFDQWRAVWPGIPRTAAHPPLTILDAADVLAS